MVVANPLYDVVFKYLMNDNSIAKKIISLIIGEEIEQLDWIEQLDCPSHRIQ